MSNSSLTVAGAAEDTVAENSAEVAVASATVEASMTLNFAVPAAIAVIGHQCVFVDDWYTQATGVVADPPIRASAAAEATMYACPAQLVPEASVAVTATAESFEPTTRLTGATLVVRVEAAFA